MTNEWNKLGKICPMSGMYTRYHEIFLLSTQKQLPSELYFNGIFKEELVTHLSMLIYARTQTP